MRKKAIAKKPLVRKKAVAKNLLVVNVQLKEASEQNLEVTNMTDFKKKIKEQKRKDRERAGKKENQLLVIVYQE